MISFLLFDMPNFASSEVIIALITLTFLEIVLGVDNIIFITIAANKLPEQDKKKAINIGLVLAMALRIALLFGISILTRMTKPFFELDLPWLQAGFTGQSVILILGGLFLLYKSVSEIHHKLEGDHHDGTSGGPKKISLSNAIIQITLINIVFSFDSILTAVGMTNGIFGALPIMIIAVVLSVAIMIVFANPVSRFVNKHPTIQILGLSFLILIGFMLILEGGHLAHLEFFDMKSGPVAKGYLYFAIGFALTVEFLNLRLRKNINPVELNSYTNDAKKEGLLK